MRSTLIELVQSVICTAGFTVFLLPPGYLIVRLFNFKRIRERTPTEKLLWSLVLSIPAALILAELLGRIFSPSLVLGFFLLMAVVALSLVLLDMRGAQKEPPASGATRFALVVAALLAVYILLAVLDVQIGHRLFVPTIITDWSVRIPLVRSSISGPIPPLNVLSDIGNTVPHLRYYYFWYVLCAQPARLFHLPPTAAFSASEVWAAFAFIAIVFLSLKYLVGLRRDIRKYCLLSLLPLLVIGLDILQVLVTLRIHSWHPHLDMEWWRGDRTPALLTTVLYSPHHIAGVVCCFVAVFALVATSEEDPLSRFHLGSFTGRAFLAGLAWAACAGTSTFLALIFILVCLLWTVDLVRTRQFVRTGALAASGVIAYVLSRPYLHELRSTSSAAHGLVVFAWRSSSWTILEFHKEHILVAHPFEATVVRQLLIVLLDFMEVGFFFFVAASRFRNELYPALRGRIQTTQAQRLLWTILFSAAIFALFVSSSVTQSANDIGMHAGMIVRLILVLWSVPYLKQIWDARHNFSHQTVQYKLTIVASMTCLVLGLAGGLYGIAMNRLYIPLFDSGRMSAPVDLFVANHLTERFSDIRATWSTLDRQLPPNAVVLFDPTGKMSFIFTRYSNRQIVANDGGCGTAFGGDYDQCIPLRVSVRHLFGTENQPTIVDEIPMPIRPLTTATPADFAAVCKNLSLDAVMVDSTDPVWNEPNSWVWKLHPAVAEPTARAFLCNKSAL